MRPSRPVVPLCEATRQARDEQAGLGVVARGQELTLPALPLGAHLSPPFRGKWWPEFSLGTTCGLGRSVDGQASRGPRGLGRPLLAVFDWDRRRTDWVVVTSTELLLAIRSDGQRPSRYAVAIFYGPSRYCPIGRSQSARRNSTVTVALDRARLKFTVVSLPGGSCESILMSAWNQRISSSYVLVQSVVCAGGELPCSQEHGQGSGNLTACHGGDLIL